MLSCPTPAGWLDYEQLRNLRAFPFSVCFACLLFGSLYRGGFGIWLSFILHTSTASEGCAVMSRGTSVLADWLSSSPHLEGSYLAGLCKVLPKSGPVSSGKGSGEGPLERWTTTFGTMSVLWPLNQRLFMGVKCISKGSGSLMCSMSSKGNGFYP